MGTPLSSALVDFGVLRYTWSRAVTTSPNTRVEVSVLGRLDMFLTTREPPSCFAGAPTSVWHRSRPSHLLSQRFERDTTAKVIAGKLLFVVHPFRACTLSTIGPSQAVYACAE